MTLNLPFLTPKPCGRFYETLPKQVQEHLFLNYHAVFKADIKARSGHAIESYIFEIETLESVLQDNNHSEIVSYLHGEETDEDLEKTNPFTGEKVLAKKRSVDNLSDAQARDELAKEILRRREFLNSSAEVLMDKFWKDDVEDFSESYLFEAASNLSELTQVISEFKRHQLVQEVIDRAGRSNLHESYPAEAIKCREMYEKAEALDREGDSSQLEALQTLSVQALTYKSQGRRITSEGGPCYICGKFVWPFNGELLLWSEIPREIRSKYVPEVFQKWHIRHFQPECSRPEYGKREIFRHPPGPFDKRNAKPEKCIVCEVNVPAESGWLIPASLVPKWRQVKPAFPGAKTKNYYVSCGRAD